VTRSRELELQRRSRASKKAWRSRKLMAGVKVKAPEPDKRFIDRDARGWRIPHKGTRSRAIYTGMLAGKSPVEIQADVGGTLQSIRVLMWRIRHPIAANTNTSRYRRAHDAKDAA